MAAKLREGDLIRTDDGMIWFACRYRGYDDVSRMVPGNYDQGDTIMILREWKERYQYEEDVDDSQTV